MLVLLHEAVQHADGIRVGVGDGPQVVVQHGLLHAVRLHGDVSDECDADDGAQGRQRGVDGDGVAVEGGFGQGVDARLREVDQAGHADDGAVDAAEGREAEDFGRVVGHGGVVERAEEDEEGHVDVGGPQGGDRAYDADGGDEEDEDEENAGGADVVE